MGSREHYAKWQEVAATLSSMDEFEHCGGVKPPSVREKWNSIVQHVEVQFNCSKPIILFKLVMNL